MATSWLKLISTLKFNSTNSTKYLVSLEEVVRVARCCGNVPCRPEIIYMMYSGLGNVSFFHGCSYNCLAISFLALIVEEVSCHSVNIILVMSFVVIIVMPISSPIPYYYYNS